MTVQRIKVKASSWIIALILFTLCHSPLSSDAQDRKSDLQSEIKQIEADIAYTNKLLSETKQSRQSSLNGLAILQQNIRQRERLINTMKAELVMLEKDIKRTNDSIFTLSGDLKNLKDEYAKIIHYAYRNRNSYDQLVFIFSSEDFNQAYRRIKYFQQYGTYRRTQAELITKTQTLLTEKELYLQSQVTEKNQLLSKEQTEKSSLEAKKAEANRSIQDLSQKEKELKASLREKEKAVAELDKAIKAIIAEEIRLAEERARAESGTKNSSGFALTPEEQQLSADFSSNKGKLPWPTARGVVSSTFGEHQHPVLPRVKVKNNGIDILTSEGEYARAVFEGVVTRVISVPNFNNVVIIRHGEFLTVYSNLDEVLVTKDQKVQTKQNLGRVYTNRNERKTELHFELWQAKELMNPTNWLAR
jgi:septal ring factor EnvC (AmiA/AmiB activator)